MIIFAGNFHLNFFFFIISYEQEFAAEATTPSVTTDVGCAITVPEDFEVWPEEEMLDAGELLAEELCLSASDVSSIHLS